MNQQKPELQVVWNQSADTLSEEAVIQAFVTVLLTLDQPPVDNRIDD